VIPTDDRMRTAERATAGASPMTVASEPASAAAPDEGRHLSEEELQRWSDAFWPMRTPRGLARFIARHPRILPHALRAAARSAWNGGAAALRDDPTLYFLMSRDATRHARADARLGDEWGGTRSFVQAFAAIARPADSCLEIGCGGGKVTGRIRPLVRSLMATDVSEGILAEAQRNTANLGPIEFVAEQGHGGGLPDGTFDIVASHDVFESFDFDELIEYCRNVARALRPGGHFVFSTYVYDSEEDFATATPARQGRSRVRIFRYPVEWYASVARIAGLELLGNQRCHPGDYAPSLLEWLGVHTVFVLRKPELAAGQ